MLFSHPLSTHHIAALKRYSILFASVASYSPAYPSQAAEVEPSLPKAVRLKSHPPKAATKKEHRPIGLCSFLCYLDKIDAKKVSALISPCPFSNQPCVLFAFDFQTENFSRFCFDFSWINNSASIFVIALANRGTFDFTYINCKNSRSDQPSIRKNEPW